MGREGDGLKKRKMKEKRKKEIRVNFIFLNRKRKYVEMILENKVIIYVVRRR